MTPVPGEFKFNQTKGARDFHSSKSGVELIRIGRRADLVICREYQKED